MPPPWLGHGGGLSQRAWPWHGAGPEGIRDAICEMLSNELGFLKPREYQIDAIIKLIYQKAKPVHLIWKTGEEKYLVL